MGNLERIDQRILMWLDPIERIIKQFYRSREDEGLMGRPKGGWKDGVK